ncbi:MAG: dephospho-CoA kinase [Planctomycetota bacterium]
MNPAGDPPREIVILGLAGGVASGKSTVARRFQELGAVLIEADRLAHEALEDETVKPAIIDRFGGDVLDESGHVSRPALARAAFDDESVKRFLESLIHPVVRARIEERIGEVEDEIRRGARQAKALIVLDVPLLFETPWAERCDHIVFIEAGEAQRAKRASEERGWSETEVARREKFQKPVNEKRERSDYRIDNTQTLDRTYLQVDALFRELTGSTSTGSLPPGR